MPITLAGTGAVTGTSSINGLAMPSDAIAPGMVLIAQASVSASSGVSFNNCFSSNYENYVIEVAGVSDQATSVGARVRLRVGGIDNTSSVYYTHQIYSTNTAGPTRAYTNDSWLTVGAIGNNSFGATVTLQRPFSTVNTSGQSQYATGAANDNYGGYNAHLVANNISYDGFTFYTSAGVFSGSIRIYGYRNT